MSEMNGRNANENNAPDPAKYPHGEKEQPIGSWTNPDPSEQNTVFTVSGPYAAPGEPVGE